MSATVDSDVIRVSPFAAELSDDQCEALAQIVTPRRLEDEEVLLREGHIDQAVHVVVSGRLAVIKDTGMGEEIIHTLRPGELAGAMGFIDGLEHSATLRSAGETEVFSLERAKLEAMLQTHPTLVYQVMRAIIRSVHSIVRRMNDQHVQLTNYIAKQGGRY